MKSYKVTDWLPTTKKEMEMRGWDELDVILFSGDAYVDHPSFGAAVVGRILEAEGLKVAIVPQPNWRDDLRDFKKLGKPRLFFGISAGCMDSMVNKYTANKRLRSDDAYTPDAKLVYVGGLVSRDKIDEVLDDGFDAIQMGRALLNEPGFVNRMKEEGEVRCSCGHSNYCIGRMYTVEMACHKHLKEQLPKSLVKEIADLEKQ